MAKEIALAAFSHTPGPWELWPEVGSSYPNPHLVYISVGPVGADRVASTGVYGRKRSDPTNGKKPVVSEEECRANARLIAAAPELLEVAQEALQQIVKYGEFFCEEDFDPTVDRLRNAIAKARGDAA